MKKMQRKDAFRNIRKRIVSYLSICLVIMLGLGGLFTTRYMGAGLDKQASDYYDAHNFKNYEIISSLGISEKSLEEIKSNEYVQDAEGVLEGDGSVTFNGRKRNVTIISLTERISAPDIAEGEMPKGKNECIVGEDFAEVEGIKVGDKIKIALAGMENDDMKDLFADEEEEEKEKDDAGDGSILYSKEFTVTGLMHHPDYLRRKSVNIVTLPLSAFNEDETGGLFTHAFVKTAEPEGVSMLSDKYFEETADTSAAMETLTQDLEEHRTQEMKDEANAYIDAEWALAEAQLADAEGEIAAGEAELDARLADGRHKLNSAQRKLNRTIAKYRKKINDGKAKLKKAKKAFALADKNLPKAKKYVKQMKNQYSGDLKQTLRELNKINSLLAKIDKIVDRNSPEYKKAEKELADFILKKEASIRKLQAFCKKSEVKSAAKKLKEISGGKIDATGIINKIANFDVDTLIKLAKRVSNGESIDSFVKKLNSYASSTQAMLNKVNQYENLISTFEKNRSKYKKQISSKEKEIKNAEKKLAAAKKKYQKQIDAGWSRYYAEKAKYETKLEEAKLLLAENRELAEKKLAEARAEVDKIEGDCIVLDRKGNAGYVDIKTNLDAIHSMGIIFGVLFTIITAIVCFSTLMIIIDEQKTLVGTSKAFGFFKREVLGKYMVFGVTAAIVGSLMAIALALGLSGFVQHRYANSGMYPIGVAKSIVTPGSTLFYSGLIIAVTIAATVIACSGILKSPASVLMKGAVSKKEKKNKKEKKTSSGRGGSLYSRLIIRNVIEDKARVLVTVAIIAFSCMLIGIGISMKFAYDGMLNRQASDVNRFDIRMDMNADVTDKDKEALTKVLEEEGTDYLPATFGSSLYRWNNRLDGYQYICADPERIGDFYGITDAKTGEDIPLPAEGILIQKRMHESYGMEVGDKLTVLDSSLKEYEAPITGTFVNYVGRTAALSPEAYKAIFGSSNKINTYFIKLKGADSAALQEKLLAVTDNISFVSNDEFKKKFESASMLYNILVIITTGVAILISFMILTNLANIYLTRKKKELTIMRVNGFSVKQTKGYLSKESLFTTAAGLALGVLAGALLTPVIIKLMQQPDLEFVKSFQIIAWAAAVVLEALFSLIINTLVFRKVKDLNLRDIA